jgi:diguanylate cyclase (GGDEF)-like protein
MDLRLKNGRAGRWRALLDEARPMFAFARTKLWSILLWPAIALVVGGVGWWHVATELDRAHRDALGATERRVGAYADDFAERTQRAIADVDRLLLLIRRDWSASGDRTRLEGADRQGIFSAQYVGVAILDRDGRLLTSSPQAPLGLNFANKPYFTVQQEARADKLFISAPLRGQLSHRKVIAFSRRLVSDGGQFNGIVVMTMLPEYFTVFYSEGLLGHYGYVAVEGTDGVQRASRTGHDMQPPNAPLLRGRLGGNAAQGVEYYRGAQWFPDGRSRIVGWHLVPGYDLAALVGVEQGEALAGYVRYRDNLLMWAWWNTGWLVLATLLATGSYMFASWKKHQLDAGRAAYRLATEDAGDGFFIGRPVRGRGGEVVDFDILDCNQHGAELFGLRALDVIGHRLSELYRPESWDAVRRRLCKAWNSGVVECELRVPEGERLKATWVRYKAVRANGDLAVTLRDISESKAHLHELERRSNEDSLTGLPNRNWIRQHLPEALERARAGETGLAVLFIDLDGFKTVNDALGHATGDELLCTVGRRLKIAVRPRDHVVRLGGDEFVVVLESVTGPEAVEHVAERVMAAFRDAFHLQHSTHVLGASIGISLFPQHGADAETLLKNADIAMYSVKTEGKGSYRFFRPQFYEAIRTRLETEMELRRAIELQQFVVYYQPRIDLAAGTLSSMEALVRWERPGKGLTGPDSFIPLAEETGLIGRLGELVIDRVCQQLGGWASAGRRAVPVSVNVSPRQFGQSDIFAMFMAAAQRHGVPPGLLEIEVTESSMMQEGIGESIVFRQLRERGIKLCIDDFGTGYSSLSQLQRLHFDVLKIDRAFVLQLERPEGDALIASMIAMAHALGMTVVAEGVETSKQMQLLKTLGCDEGQGFYFSRPVPASERPLDQPAVATADGRGS